ncbi:beta strand repeat-containing protein, partial [Pedobacter sp. AK017]|uniref:beta strand repeat-containing protein n=1 Tax=Pedobacter sp. AK017 TaxID=2723073 RepID=UPI00160A4E32
LALKAPLASPAFTGTVTGITKTMVGLGNVDDTADADKPVSTAAQTALNLKVNYTDTAAMLSPYAKQSVSQSAIALKVNIADTAGMLSPYAKQSATQSALALKAPLASPAFTGTVTGITKTMVGLGNVDDTTDADKPVSTAAQTSLNLKADLASPILTGTPTAPTAAATVNDSQIATTAFVKTAVDELNSSTSTGFVNLTTAQTIAGAKSFSADITVNGIIIGKGNGSITTGNLALGTSVLTNNTTGQNVIAIGQGALSGNTTGNTNLGIGVSALSANSTGTENVAIGTAALANTTGSFNTAVGRSALLSGGAISRSTSVGYKAGMTNTGSNNTFLGAETDQNSASPSITNATAIGYLAKVTTANQIQLGNTSVTLVNTSGAITSAGVITGNTIVKSGGLATEFLKANGTIDNNTYLTTSASTTALALKADLASPILTGIPLAPTAGAGTNNTQIATTAFVSSEIAAGNAANVTGVVLGANGGTGIANTGKTIILGGNLTTTGAFATTLTSTAATTVTLPVTGTLATLTGTETLTNKTLTAPVISTITNTGTLTLPTTTGTLALTTGNVATATLASTVTTNANSTGDVTSVGNVTTYNNVVPSAKGGAGSINGILKANGSGVTSLAVAGTDYLTPSGNTTGNAANVTGVVLGANGGTGIANTGKTITLGGNLTTTGAFATTLTSTAATTVTLPVTGTLATLTGTETLTNKTLTAPVISTITNTGTLTLPTTTGILALTSGDITGSSATVTTAAQPAITSVGTLTSLTSSGAITGNTIVKTGGTGAQILAADGSVITAGLGIAISGAAISANIREVADEFTATAAQTSFTLTQSKAANSKVKMYVNGIRISNTAYSVSGTTLIYVPASNGSYALVAGDRVQMDYYY